MLDDPGLDEVVSHLILVAGQYHECAARHAALVEVIK